MGTGGMQGKEHFPHSSCFVFSNTSSTFWCAWTRAFSASLGPTDFFREVQPSLARHLVSSQEQAMLSVRLSHQEWPGARAFHAFSAAALACSQVSPLADLVSSQRRLAAVSTSAQGCPRRAEPVTQFCQASFPASSQDFFLWPQKPPE
ncbi:hypothetical protein F751_4504 [Auxenochlorella protothecoides]|uniref:Uncharacterized protein n=1 Tax=Auxenochlorella protothecoides TaxID=3075 RepID=A0A087SND0_AUXPR|nr:hypothetical protein F751_4504 [Auxenochlorella protothecoides]KFM27234.1 hypothetical protein F751_4504 [Auxenochlorella protothecoides]